MYFSNILTRAASLALAAILLTACGGGGSGPAQNSVPGAPTLNGLPSPPAVSNLLRVTVDNGPSGTGYNVNRLYATVSICPPGSTNPAQCQTIDHVLVDTGSSGLRLLSSAMAPGLNLNRRTGPGGLPLLNCVQFVDSSFAWGPVARADIVLAGKTAANVPIQVIADPAFNSLAAPCSGGGTAIDTAAILGANGILGIGLFKQDCEDRCVGNPGNDTYFTCTDVNCTATKGATASIAQQVTNPVSLFASDNNGVLIDLPAVSPPGGVSLSGTLTLGIGTQPLFTGAVLLTDSFGFITTLLAGQTLDTSFLDTGSNGLYFDSATIPKCLDSSAEFYCPTLSTTLTLPATLVGANGVTSSVTFSVDNATALFFGATNTVLPTLAGDIGEAKTFDWGLPFFYGRRVFIGIEDQVSPLGTGPFYAF